MQVQGQLPHDMSYGMVCGFAKRADGKRGRVMIDTISFLILCLAVFLLGRKVNTLEHNIEAIKEWLKICGVIDIDKITDEFREWKESEGE